MLTPPWDVDMLMVDVVNNSRHEVQIVTFGFVVHPRRALWRLVRAERARHLQPLPSDLGRMLGLTCPKTVPVRQSTKLGHELAYAATAILEASPASELHVRAWVRTGDGLTRYGKPLAVARTVLEKVQRRA